MSEMPSLKSYENFLKADKTPNFIATEQRPLVQLHAMPGTAAYDRNLTVCCLLKLQEQLNDIGIDTFHADLSLPHHEAKARALEIMPTIYLGIRAIKQPIESNYPDKCVIRKSNFDNSIFANYLESALSCFDLDPIVTRSSHQCDYYLVKHDIIFADVVIGSYHNRNDIRPLEKRRNTVAWACTNAIYNFLYSRQFTSSTDHTVHASPAGLDPRRAPKIRVIH